jgi:hypothetical protein
LDEIWWTKLAALSSTISMGGIFAANSRGDGNDSDQRGFDDTVDDEVVVAGGDMMDAVLLGVVFEAVDDWSNILIMPSFGFDVGVAIDDVEAGDGSIDDAADGGDFVVALIVFRDF